jgi:hypothetical protein
MILSVVNPALHLTAYYISGYFTLITIPITIYDILLHLHYYRRPDLQHYIIRILIMVPVYSIDSWFALRFRTAALYMDTMRECYESYVIYNFVFFLIACIGNTETVNETIAGKPQHKHIIPFCCLRRWNMNNGEFLARCRQGVLSYTVIRVLTSMLTLVCQIAGVYEEGNFSFQYAYVWILLINNFAQTWALYCFMLFYQVCKQDLAYINPLPKFLSVKAVVFFSWWQGVGIAILFQFAFFQQYLEDNDWLVEYTSLELQVGLQNFLICIEMFIAAMIHHRIFSYKNFAQGAEGPRPFMHNIGSVFDVSDVKNDVLDHVLFSPVALNDLNDDDDSSDFDHDDYALQGQEEEVQERESAIQKLIIKPIQAARAHKHEQ